MRRSLLVAVLAWVGVVAAASVLTWTVINSAGQQVLTQSSTLQVPRAAATVRASAPAAAASSAPTTSSGAQSRPPQPSPRPSRSPEPHHTTAPPVAAVPHQSSWHGTAGTVSVRCTGARAALVSATPSDSYAVEVGSRGPAQVEVTFKATGHRTQVQAGCRSGAPRFSAETETEAGDD